MILVAIVLFVFEGRLIYTMFSQKSGPALPPESTGTNTGNTDNTHDQDSSDTTPVNTGTGQDVEIIFSTDGSGNVGLAGLATLTPSTEGTDDSGDTQSPGAASEALNLTSLVPKQAESVDDSYFSDAVFIGDSRMEGFRNSSGITQGTFLTSVGMCLTSITSTKVNSYDGPITVYQGLSGIKYGKIYLMLGTNDLGFYPWEEFPVEAKRVLEQMHALQKQAIIYICSVIYVEESKTSTDYVNNANVLKVNGYLQQLCEELDYCYYINLNEIFSNGWQSLIEGASMDGVHLEPAYTKLMLEYLKSHYI